MKHTTHRTVLTNGIRLLFIDVPGTNNFDMVISIGAGYRMSTKDAIDKYEVPHVLEHMVFDGSSTLDSADALQDVFNAGGGEWNGMTNAYSTNFLFHNRARNARQLIDAAFGAVFHPLLSEQSFEEELKVVENELNDSMSDFSLGADQYTQQQILPELVVSTDTQLARLPNVEYDDALRFHKKYYGTANTTVVILCDGSQVSLAKIRSMIKAATKSAPKLSVVTTPTFDVMKSDGAVVPVKIDKTVGRSFVSLQYIAEGNANPKTLALLGMFCSMLNGLSSYSVNYKLRKLGVSYGTAFASLRSVETYGIEVALDADNDKFTNVLARTLSLTREFMEAEVTDEQFDRLKAEVIESIEDAESSTDGLMSWYTDDFMIDDIIMSPSEHRTMLQTINKADVFDLARQIIRFDNQYGTIFTNKRFRGTLAVSGMTEAILKDGRQVDDDFISSFSSINGGFMAQVNADVQKFQQDDPNAGPYRKLLIFINRRPLLAWGLNVIKLAVAIFLVYLGLEELSGPDAWLGWIRLAIAAYLLFDVASDVYFRTRNK